MVYRFPGPHEQSGRNFEEIFAPRHQWSSFERLRGLVRDLDAARENRPVGGEVAELLESVPRGVSCYALHFRPEAFTSWCAGAKLFEGIPIPTLLVSERVKPRDGARERVERSEQFQSETVGMGPQRIQRIVRSTA
jgi:hypothetical protein